VVSWWRSTPHLAEYPIYSEIMLGHSVSNAKHLQNDVGISIFHRVPDHRLWNKTNIPFYFERSVKLVWTFVQNISSSFYIRCTLINVHHNTFATYGCFWMWCNCSLHMKWLQFVLVMFQLYCWLYFYSSFTCNRRYKPKCISTIYRTRVEKKTGLYNWIIY
jgi:hypothetical protein